MSRLTAREALLRTFCRCELVLYDLHGRALLTCELRRHLWVLQFVQARHPHGLSSEPAIATIAKAVLSALSYMHSVGYMHRDVKVSVAQQMSAYLRSHAVILTDRVWRA